MKYKKIVSFLLLCFLLSSCGKYSGIPEKYHALLDVALEKAGENRAEMEQALKTAKGEQKEGVAFLISHMPERDLTSMSSEYLLNNVNLAYTARNRFSWAKSVPDSIFLNEVLPYASMNEKRDDWRADFYNRFAPYVENCKTLEEAIIAVNENIRDEVKVDYNTKRKKPDQSPTESMEIGMASCSGLSILLTDAFRSVGIPSRIAGTSSWHDNRGNHTWSEVWLNGKWYFTEYYYPGKLDHSWFLPDAGQAVPGNKRYAIHATSFAPTGMSFPLVWARDITYVPAIDVSQRYIDVYKETQNAQLSGGNYVKLYVKMFKDKKNSKNSEDRVKVNVDIFNGEDQMGGGSTAGPNQDMNDVLEFLVEKNNEYTLKYFPKGQSKAEKVQVKDEPVEVVLFVND